MDKSNPLVYCLLSIDGEDFLAKNSYIVELHQYTNNHDTLTITTSDDSLDSFEGYVMEHSRKLLGKKLSIKFHRYGVLCQTFTGIISNIRNKKDEGGGYGKLYITGHSPSILLENGKDCQSYENLSLEQIITAATSEYSEVKVNVFKPNTKYTIPYTVQYKESDYQFIKRLACRYGEYFYYDGEQLIFGNTVQLLVELGENIDLIDIKFEMMVKPQSFKYLAYDSISAEIREQDAEGIQTQHKDNIFQAIAIKASKEVFKKKAEMLFNATSQQNVRKDLEEMVKRQKESREHLMQVKGRSRDPQLKIGSLAEILDINGKAMETYRILEIKHYHNGNEYYNEFVGIPDVFHPPYQNSEALPIGEEQMARVVDNNDPLGMGRVRVQMAWQEHNQTKTPWIRMVQPYAGSGKGFYFIPEIGEEVLIGFEGGNAEKPYIIGTQYNGKEKSGYSTSDNKVKAIHTRSGTKIILNDAEGSVFIEDPSGSSIYLDGKQKISFNGVTLEFNAQKIIMNATDSTQITTNDYILNALSKIYIFGNWFKQQINGFVQLWSIKTLIKGTDVINIEAKEAKLHGSEKMIAHSDKLALVNSKETLEVKGQKRNNFSNNAENLQVTPNEEIGLAVVYFRTLDAWQGEFGFDWLREKDNDLALSEDPAYKEILEAAYKDGVSDYTGVEAYNKLKDQYHRHPISFHHNTSNLQNKNGEGVEYYVPYLSLFSRDFVESLRNSTTPPEVLPKYEAELKVLIEIDQEIEYLSFEYDQSLIEITPSRIEENQPTLLKNAGTIKITCLKDLDSDKEIRIYAYPKITAENTANNVWVSDDLRSIINRKLAGRIIVLQNDSRVRKEEKILLIEVVTNISGMNRRIGIFENQECTNLYNSLYQALLVPKIQKTILGLSSNDKFKVNGRHIYGDTILYSLNRIQNRELYIDIKDIFRNERDANGVLINIQYQDYFTIFNFGVNSNSTNVLGAVESIGRRNVIMFTTSYDDSSTLNHEVLHGLGLCHTHRDSIPLHLPMYKYVYPCAMPLRPLHPIGHPEKSTTNIMSYRSIAYSTWRWQWNIINPNIRER